MGACKNNMRIDPAPFPPAEHDHRRCIQDMMARVEDLCVRDHLRLTAQRRRVLDIVAASHEALGAYEILARMGRTDRALAPISIYRALAFLVEHGLVHRVESLNAYVACTQVGDRHLGQFLVCSACRRVAELECPLIAEAIFSEAEAASFAVTRPIVEITGLCNACRAANP
jgi:Fur family zinc uptake transcriptional regulator